MEQFTVPVLTENGFGNNTSTHHHHKDHMLAAGNTPSTSFMYDTANKPDAPVEKSDYAAFTNCIQQSALLDHRVMDSNIDSVSLSGLCDLKFPSPSSLSNTINTDSNFKNIALMNIETTSSVLIANKPTATAISSESGSLQTEHEPSFTNLIFPKDNTVVSQQQHCLTAAETHNTTTTTATTTASATTSRYIVMNSEESVANLRHRSSEGGGEAAKTGLVDFRADSVAATSNANNAHQVQMDPQNNSYRFDFNNLRTTNNNSDSSKNNNCPIANQNTANAITITANKIIVNDTVCAKPPTNESPAKTGSMTTSVPLKSNPYNSTSLALDNANAIDGLGSQRSSNVSSASDSTCSSGDFIDLESTDHNGYQDNTSSHSQQSGGGGSNGGGGGGGGGPTTSNSASVALLNGISVAGSGGGINPNATSTSGGYMSLLPPVVGGATSSGVQHGGTSATGTSASAGGPTGEGIDFKHLFEELCPVCGDKVSGYHYGLLTCESCKGFFKRTVQNKKVYTCVAERSCHIDKTQRKRCPYCRFQKCLEVGMKLEAVRADRMRGGRNKFGPMYKRDRARKLQVMRQRQLALQALRTSIGSVDMKTTPLSPAYQQAYPNMNIKQEIQIPQVSSLTQSPDSSPSPIAIALGQVNTNAGVIAAPLNGSTASGEGGGSNSNAANNNNTTSEEINRSSSGNCHEAGTGSLQGSAESKLCFDSGTHPSSTEDSLVEPIRVSPTIREYVQSIDDREWQTQLFALLQKQTYNQVEVDLFELMCKVLDQNLFSQVDWARNTVFFKDLKVDDQMKLLQHSWSDMLVLDHLHQRIHNGLPDETQLNNGQVFNLLWLGLLGVPNMTDYFNQLQSKLQALKFDMGDYVCLKFLILLNPEVRGIINKKTVVGGHQHVQAALLDYTLTCYPSVTDKFRALLSIIPDIHAMAERGEAHLYSKHCEGSAPTQTLLMEMLHAKRKV